MKKLVTIMSAAALLFAVTSCASSEQAAVEEPAVEAAVEEVAEEVIDYEEQEMPEGEVVLMDDFEEWYWDWADLGNNDLGISCEQSTDWATEGPNSMKMEFAENNLGNKGSYGCYSPAETDWTDAKYIVVDVYNPNDLPVDFCLVVQAGDSWVWNQTEAQHYPKGEHRAVFDISSFSGLEDVHVLFLCACTWNEGTLRAGTFYIDNYRVVF